METTQGIRSVPVRVLIWSCLLGVCYFAPPLSAADVSYFGVVKSIQYQQTNQPTPTLVATNPYSFTAFAIASANGVLTNATVKPSNSTPLRQLIMETNRTAWRYEERFATESAMDAVYPYGSWFSPINYNFTLYGTNDGIGTASMNYFILFSQVSYPPTPQITNLSVTANIDTTRALTLGWTSLGGSQYSIVQLSVLDASSNIVYTTALPFQPGALDGNSLGTTIPPNTLPGGATLVAHLSAGNPGLPNTNSIPGAFGVPALAKDTEFRLQTRPSPVRPVVQLLSAGPGSRIRVTGELQRLYQVEASADLLAWTNVASVYATSMPIEVTDTDAPGVPARFYRARVGD
jgi:hypothetical protein